MLGLLAWDNMSVSSYSIMIVWFLVIDKTIYKFLLLHLYKVWVMIKMLRCILALKPYVNLHLREFDSL